MFLETTEWAKRLLPHIYNKMPNDDILVFDKTVNPDIIPDVDIIVTANPHVPIDEIIINRNKAKSLFVVEGLNNRRYNQGDYVNKIAVWGENMKRDFIECGWTKDKIVITGCPRFEEHKRRALIALPAYSKSELDNDRVISDIRTALEKNNIIVIVKRHPGISNEKADILYYLHDSDIVITGASTIALHALLLDKKVIYYDTPVKLFNREKHFKPLVKSGIKICTTIGEILKETEHSKIINEYLHDSYNAAGNIIKLIGEMYGK